MSNKKKETLEENKRISPYLSDAIRLSKRLFGSNNVIAGIIFGSRVKSGISKISDHDIILLVSNEISRKQIIHSRKYFDALVVKHGLKDGNRGIIEKVLHKVEKITGMFVNYFICNINAFNKGNAIEIFSVSHFLGKLLAPMNIVFGSALQKYELFFGTVIEPKWEFEKLKVYDVVKSLVMNVLLVLGSFITAPISKSGRKYVLEACKWSLYACFYFIFHKTPTIQKSLNIFKKFGISDQYLSDFNNYRNNNTFHPKFFIQTLIQSIKLHITAIKYRSALET